MQNVILNLCKHYKKKKADFQTKQWYTGSNKTVQYFLGCG